MEHETLVALLPQHWMDAQRLLIGLTLMRLSNDPARRAEIAETAFRQLKAPPIHDRTAHPKYMEQLRMLHPSSLQRLCDIGVSELPPQWQAHSFMWNDAKKTMQGPTGQRMLAAAKLIANRIAAGSQKATQILRLVKQEFKVDWDLGPEGIEELENLLKTVRVSRASLRSRLEALQSFRNRVSLNRWEMIENALLHQWFSWPLIILLETQTGQALGFSLPIAVDISMEDSAPPVSEPGLLQSADWLNSLRRATHAARALWKNKHLSWPSAFLAKMENLSARIDLSVAEAVFAPYQQPGTDYRGYTDLTGHSADLYLALTILSKLIDPAAMENVCATGELYGGRNDEEGGADTNVITPGGVDQKWKFAYESHFFHTMLVPNTPSVFAAQNHMQVKQENTLSRFCEHVFGQKWRKHRFVRAPDIADAFRLAKAQKSSRSGSTRCDLDVIPLVNKLRINRSPVLHLEDVSACQVAKALFWFNHLMDKKADVGSYAFVRVTSDLANERMWLPIWECIGGTPETFFDFQFSSSPFLAGTALASELNKFDPTPEHPQRAPDVLVIVYTDVDTHFAAQSGISGGPFSRLKIQGLLKALNQQLEPTPLKRLGHMLGNTRVVLVKDTSPLPEGVKVASTNETFKGALSDTNFYSAVKRLSIFRYGFTFQFAARLLNIPDDECYRLLRMCARTCSDDGRPVLASAERAGEYLLQVRIEKSAIGADIAKLHFEAANAIVGIFTHPQLATNHNFGEAFGPRWLQEAQWHLQQARHLSEKASAKAYYTQRHERLSRIGEVFGFTRLRWAIDYSHEDGPEIADAVREHIEEIDRARDLFNHCHPLDLLWAARSVAKVALRLNDQPNRRNEYLKLRDYYLKLANLRIDKDRLLLEHERSACWYAYGTTRACLILREQPNTHGVESARSAIRLAETHSQHEGELLDRSWFEFMGDAERNPANAIGWYERGIVNSNIPRLQPLPTLIYKYLGALQLVKRKPSPSVAVVLASLKMKWENIRKVSSSGGLHELAHVCERFQNGREWFERSDFDYTNRSGYWHKPIRGRKAPSLEAGGLPRRSPQATSDFDR